MLPRDAKGLLLPDSVEADRQSLSVDDFEVVTAQRHD
jgi:hypothetical protein